MLDSRVYRTAFLPALIALFVVAFSLEGRPPAATSRLSADGFDPARAYGNERLRNSLRELGASFPDRRPGSAGDAGLADRVADALGAAGFRVSRREDQGVTVDGGRSLETVVGIRPGLSSRQIVVLAQRDAHRSPGLAELSGTAALLELARIFRSVDRDGAADPGERRLIGRELRKTLVLVSTSGGSGGGAGVRAWAARADPGDVDGVLVLGDLAARRPRKPWVVPWSDGNGMAPLGWSRTVETAVRQEVGSQPGGYRASSQWLRRAAPFTPSAQGELNRAALPAVLLQATGERGPAAGEPVARERLAEFGRAALRSVSALDDAGRQGRGGETADPFADDTGGIVTLRNVLPDWSVRLLVLCLLAPALLAAVDAFFRARRRGLATGPWLRWMLAVGAALPLCWIWLRLLGLTGALPAPPAPVPPAALPLDGWQALALASTVLAGALGVVVARWSARATKGARAGAAAGAAGALVGLLMSLLTLAVWMLNPYAAALLVPAAHLWLMLGMPETRLRGPRGWIALAASLAPVALVVLYQCDALRLSPLGLARTWLVAVAGGHVSLATALAGGIATGCLAALLAVLRDRGRVVAAVSVARPRTRGSVCYAGPGSLGGTESALRR